MLKFKCKHEYKNHKYLCELENKNGIYYVYQLQCCKCGKIPIFKFNKEKENNLKLYSFRKEVL